MKTIRVAVFTIAAVAFGSAYGQDGTVNKECAKRCVDTIKVENLKKSDYDYEAVNNDPAKTPAEKKKSHKKALAGYCAWMCENEGPPK